MKINIIAAKCINNGIGYQNKIPWFHKKDLKLFKELTTNNSKNAVIMGRKTYESIPESKRPLPNRHNIVISSTMNHDEKNISVFNNIQNGINYAKLMNFEELWVIGGSSIYEYFISNKLAEKLYLTEIQKEYECDTFFPKFDGLYELNSTQDIDEMSKLNIYIKTNINLSDNINLKLDQHKMAGYWG